MERCAICLFDIMKPWRVKKYVWHGTREAFIFEFGLSIRYVYEGMRVISGINIPLIWTFTPWKLRRLTCSHFCFDVLAFHRIGELYILSRSNKKKWSNCYHGCVKVENASVGTLIDNCLPSTRNASITVKCSPWKQLDTETLRNTEAMGKLRRMKTNVSKATHRKFWSRNSMCCR